MVARKRGASRRLSFIQHRDKKKILGQKVLGRGVMTAMCALDEDEYCRVLLRKYENVEAVKYLAASPTSGALARTSACGTHRTAIARACAWMGVGWFSRAQRYKTGASGGGAHHCAGCCMTSRSSLSAAGAHACSVTLPMGKNLRGWGDSSVGGVLDVSR